MQIAVTGSIATDHLMTFPGRFADSLVADKLDKVSLSFLVDELEIRRGGVAANIAFGMGCLGPAPAARRRGRPRLRRLPVLARAARRRHRLGARVSDVRHTARFVCTTDTDQNQIASFYPGAMSEARDIELKPVADRVGGLDLVVVGANDPEAMVRHTDECRQRGYRRSPPTRRSSSPAWTATEIRDLVDGAAYLFTNEYEAALTESEDRLDRRRRPRPGRRPRHHARRQGRAVERKGEPAVTGAVRPARSARPTRPASATPSAPASSPAVAWGLSHERSAQVGSLLATYVIETVGTQEYALGQRALPRPARRRVRRRRGRRGADVEPHPGRPLPATPAVEPPPSRGRTRH